MKKPLTFLRFPIVAASDLNVSDGERLTLLKYVGHANQNDTTFVSAETIATERDVKVRQMQRT